MPVHVRRSILKAGGQIGVWKFAVNIGATWRIRLNRPCPTAMRPYVKVAYFEHSVAILKKTLDHGVSYDTSSTAGLYSVANASQPNGAARVAGAALGIVPPSVISWQLASVQGGGEGVSRHPMGRRHQQHRIVSTRIVLAREKQTGGAWKLTISCNS